MIIVFYPIFWLPDQQHFHPDSVPVRCCLRYSLVVNSSTIWKSSSWIESYCSVLLLLPIAAAIAWTRCHWWTGEVGCPGREIDGPACGSPSQGNKGRTTTAMLPIPIFI